MSAHALSFPLLRFGFGPGRHALGVRPPYMLRRNPLLGSPNNSQTHTRSPPYRRPATPLQPRPPAGSLNPLGLAWLVRTLGLSPAFGALISRGRFVILGLGLALEELCSLSSACGALISPGRCVILGLAVDRASTRLHWRTRPTSRSLCCVCVFSSRPEGSVPSGSSSPVVTCGLRTLCGARPSIPYTLTLGGTIKPPPKTACGAPISPRSDSHLVG